MKQGRTTIKIISAVILALALATPLAILHLPSASAAPTVIDLGNGNKTVSWNFSNPTDYVETNVNIVGQAELAETSGALLQSSTNDFTTNGTLDTTNLTITGNSIVTTQQTSELIANGTFNNSSPWQFWEPPAGNVSAYRDASNLTGTFFHGRPAATGIQFDEMDTGVGTNWTEGRAGSPPQHSVTAFQDSTTFIEPTASVRLEVNFKTVQSNWVGLCRSGLWDWSQYGTLTAWLTTDYPGPQVLLTYVSLMNGTYQFNSSRIQVPSVWQELRFDISGFGPRLSGVTMVCLNFTNIVNVNPARIWIDNLWLYSSERTTQSAFISQIFTKGNYSSPIAGTVIFSFAYMFGIPLNIEKANLSVLIDGVPLIPPIPITNAVPWTPASYDISSVLTGRGTFNLSFAFNVTVNSSFATSLRVQIDNVSLIMPVYYGGNYLSAPLSLGRSYFFDNISWSSSNHPETNFTAEVRVGHSSDTMDGSWTQWEVHYSQPEPLLTGSTGSYLQYQIHFTTANSSASMSFDSIFFTFHRYQNSGTIETLDFTPVEQLIGWREFLATANIPSTTSVSFEASVDLGASWTPVTSGSSLSTLIGPCILIRSTLSTSNTTQTPVIRTLNVTYEYLGPVSVVTVTPSSWVGTSDDQQQFTAIGKDQFGHITLITPTWTTDDPRGSVDATGLYNPGANGSWLVCASSAPGGPIDCANVTVYTGVMIAVVVEPPVVNMLTGSYQNFTAVGKDDDGNNITLMGAQWSTDVGTFEQVGPSFAGLRAKGKPATGQVTATEGSFSGQSSVTVTTTGALQILGTVPNQQKTEDSPPWSMDLSGYLPPSQNQNDLAWWLDGVDESLYTVFGDRRFGQHTLWFTPKPNAFGSSQVVLTLKNRTGARDSQQLLIDVTPVNDPPILYGMPPIKVRQGVLFNFEYTSYVTDVDDPKSSLFLSTNDVSHSTVSGMTITYQYGPEYVGQTIPMIVRVSDGHLISEAVHEITVTYDNPPNIRNPLPDLVMYEDEMLPDAFPSNMSMYFNDLDGETLQYSASSSHLTVEFWPSSSGFANVRLIPETDWYGNDELTIRAQDPGGALVEQTAVVAIIPVNDAPNIDWQEDIYIKYDVPYVLDLSYHVSDVDDPQTVLVMTANQTDITTVDGFSIHFMMPRHVYGTVSSFLLSIRVSDGQAFSWSNITVRVGDNLPPALIPTVNLPDVTFNEDESAIYVFDLDDYFEDSDGPIQLAYTYVAGSVIVSLAMNNSMSFSAPQDWNGQELVRVKASDGIAIKVTHFTVRVIPVNDAPILTTISDQDMGTGGVRAIDLRPYVRDVDNNVTELTFSTSSSRAVIYGYTLILDYTGGATSESVTITVSDTVGQDSTSFNVIVNNIPPVNGGDGEPEPNPLWPWGLLVLLVIPIIGAMAFTRMKAKRLTFEDIFMISADGRLMIHSSNQRKVEMDQEQLSNMLTAIAAFIIDGYKKEGGDLREFKMDDKRILIDRGHYFYLAVTFTGEPPEKTGESLETLKEDMEEEFADTLHDWTGSAHEISVLKPFIDSYVANGKYNKGSWKKYS